MREDESNWRDEIDRELQEAEQYFEETSDSRQKQYEEKLEAWKLVHSMYNHEYNIGRIKTCR